MKKANTFLKVVEKHSYFDANGIEYNKTTTDSTRLGYLSNSEISEYQKTIENSNFTDSGYYCMRTIKPIINNKKNNTLNLNLYLYPDTHSNKCQYACYLSDCPFAIVHGKCRHPLVIELIGKKFYPGLYSKEYQEYLKGIER